VKFADDFESFLPVQVNLNKSRLDDLQERVKAIESFIAADDAFADIFLDIIPAGSWGPPHHQAGPGQRWVRCRRAPIRKGAAGMAGERLHRKPLHRVPGKQYV